MHKLQPGNGRELRPNCHKNQLITADPARRASRKVYKRVLMCVIYLSLMWISYEYVYIFIFIWPEIAGVYRCV